jgi:phage gpG-like protein
MAGAVTIDIQGLDALLKNLDNKANTLTQDVGDEIYVGALEISTGAKQAVRKDSGFLASRINAEKESTLISSVSAQSKYAAYVEFGTGTLVDVPAGLEDYAIQFKGRGIRQVNLPARPFLFNTAKRLMPKIIDKIKQVLVK